MSASSIPRTLNEAQQMFESGQLFLHLHLALSCMSFEEQQRAPVPLQPLQWAIKPKLHYFYHQLIWQLEGRMNLRHHHTYTDEDSMRWLKLCCRYAPIGSEAVERHLLRLGRARLKATGLCKRKALEARFQSDKRSRV